MTDTSEQADPGMHLASVHASTEQDPPRSAHTDSPNGHSIIDSPITALRPSTLKLSTSHISKLPTDANSLISPLSAISSQGESRSTESLSQQKSSQNTEGDVQNSNDEEHKRESVSHSSSPDYSSGTKRTASGQVKRASVHGLGEVLARSNGAKHTHTSSTISNGSKGNVVELSQQLRTKLKYAMVKVQNGWQTRSLDEVESLASQSPRSTVSGFQHFHDRVLSPRTAMSHRLHGDSSDSGSSDSTEVTESRGLVPVVGSPQVQSRRALAPPVDIVPGSHRRPTPNSIHLAANSSVVQSRALHYARRPNSQRTPSQNAAMEADAVETLLFMASPGNSAYNPPSQASQESSLRSVKVFSTQTSPLRAQFSQTSVTSPKRVAFSNGGSGPPVFDKDALIDRMLDELSDDSDEELEQAFRLAETGKLATTVST